MTTTVDINLPLLRKLEAPTELNFPLQPPAIPKKAPLPPLPTLSDRQTKALKFIIEFIEGNGASPIWNEIAKHLGSTTRNPAVVRSLIKRGYLQKLPIRERNLALTDLARQWYKNHVTDPDQGRLL